MAIALETTTIALTGRVRLALSLAGVLALVCAAANALHATMDAISELPIPICATDASSNSPLNKVEIVASHALPDMPGKRVTVVRVTYGPGGFTPPHRHGGTVTAYITKGRIKSKLDRKSTRLNSSHVSEFRMPSSA